MASSYSPHNNFGYFITYAQYDLNSFLDFIGENCNEKFSEPYSDAISKIKSVQKKIALKEKSSDDDLSFREERELLQKSFKILSSLDFKKPEKVELFVRAVFMDLDTSEDCFRSSRACSEKDTIDDQVDRIDQHEFIDLILKKDSEAERELLQSVEVESPEAIQLIWKLSSKSAFCLSILQEKAHEDCFIKSAGTALLPESHLSETLPILEAIKILVLDEKWQGCGLFLNKITTRFQSPKLKILFLRILLTNNPSFSFCNYLLTHLLEGDSLFIEIISSFFSLLNDPQLVKKNHFLSFLLSQSKKQVQVQILLLVTCQLFAKDSLVIEAVTNAFRSSINSDSLDGKKFNSLSIACKILIKNLRDEEAKTLLDAASDYYCRELELDILPGDYFSFSLMSVQYQFHLLRALLERKEQLICYFLGNLNSQDYKDPILQEHLRSSKHVLMCPANDQRDLTSNLCTRLSEDELTITILEPESISFQQESFESIEGLDFIEGSLFPGLWVRDYFFQFDSAFRLPPFTRFNHEFRLGIEKERVKDLGCSLPFGVMGATSREHSQLRLFEYLGQKDQKLSLSPREVRFQFLYHEGGNVLTGESEGTSYVVIGKDDLRINRRRLQYELAELGIRRVNESWELGAPYPIESIDPSLENYSEVAVINYDEHTKSLTPVPDEVLIELMQLDFGLSEVHLVEQPDYHLDISMLLVNPKEKIILLNDSLQAHSILCQYLEEKGEISKSSDINPILSTRMEESLELAKQMKEIEDLTENDLVNAGFKVRRVAGVFREEQKEYPDQHKINFFNCISYQNQEKEPRLLALGCPDFFQKLFKETMKQHMPDVKNIFFADEAASKALLAKHGGLHCSMRFLD